MSVDIALYAERLRAVVSSYYDKEISHSEYLRQRSALCDEIERVFLGGDRVQAEASGEVPGGESNTTES